MATQQEEQHTTGAEVGLSDSSDLLAVTHTGWQCDLGNGEYDHDWEFHSDTIGDFGIIGGTYTEQWLECAVCGATKAADRDDC